VQFDGGNGNGANGVVEPGNAAEAALIDSSTPMESGMPPGSGLKCRGGDCADGICCVDVSLSSGPPDISSATSACSPMPCAMGEYQFCASDDECIDAGCVANPLGIGPQICNWACTPGTTQCALPVSPASVQTCMLNFQWGPAVPCSGGTVCVNGTCVACTPGATRCLGSDVQACDTTGNWGALMVCTTTMTCAAGMCVVPGGI
jgi:hypothetical protein